MPGTGSPAIARRRLASELRRLREQAGLTIDGTAEQLEWSAAKISRIENAKVSVLPRDVKFLLGIYSPHDPGNRARLLDLARQSRQKAWWHQHGLTVPAWLQSYAAIEAEAAVMRTYNPELVPDLLRTLDYNRAVISAQPARVGQQDADDLTALLTARQDRHLADGTPHLHAILSEAVICRAATGTEIMRAQLDHLSRASQKQHITIQVLPFSAGPHPAMDRPFMLMEFPDPTEPGIVYAGHKDGAAYLDNGTDIRYYREAFACLQAVALTPDASDALIAIAAGQSRPTATRLG